MTCCHHKGAAATIPIPQRRQARVGMTILHIPFGEHSHV
jgi:hypothetical protein